MASSSGAARQVGAMKRPASGAYGEAKRRPISPPTYAQMASSTQPSALAALLAGPPRQPPASPFVAPGLLPTSPFAASPVLRSMLAAPPLRQQPAVANPVPSTLRSMFAPPPRQPPSPFAALRLPSGARPTPKQRKLFFYHCFILQTLKVVFHCKLKLLLIFHP